MLYISNNTHVYNISFRICISNNESNAFVENVIRIQEKCIETRFIAMETRFIAMGRDERLKATHWKGKRQLIQTFSFCFKLEIEAIVIFYDHHVIANKQ